MHILLISHFCSKQEVCTHGEGIFVVYGGEGNSSLIEDIHPLNDVQPEYS